MPRSKAINVANNLYINLTRLFVWVLVCLHPINVKTDRAKIFCGISRDPREGLRMIKFLKICV